MDKKPMMTDKELTVGIIQGLWQMLMGTGRYKDVSITHDADSGEISVETEARNK